jgi:hypothetical protein
MISPHNFTWYERHNQDVDHISQRLRIDRVQVNIYSSGRQNLFPRFNRIPFKY